MKTKTLIITIVFLIFLPVQQIYAPPSVNPDWQNYPYCGVPCPLDYLKKEWAKYYDIKGEEWMEQKKKELMNAYKNGTLTQWIDSDPSKANQNVFSYYYILGEIPDKDGEYFEDRISTRELTDEDICGKGNVLVEGICRPAKSIDFRDTSGEMIPPCEGVDSITGYTKEQCLFVRYIQSPLIIGIIISAIVIGTITWSKRK